MSDKTTEPASRGWAFQAPRPEGTREDSIDEAWAEAESALPDGWTLELGDWRAEPNAPEGVAPIEAIAQPYVRRHDGTDPMVVGRGWSPAEALTSLSAGLRAAR